MPSSSPEKLKGGAAGHRPSGAHLPTAQRGSKGNELCSPRETSVTSPETAGGREVEHTARMSRQVGGTRAHELSH